MSSSFFPFDREREPSIVPTEFEVPPWVDEMFHKLDLIQRDVEKFMATMQDLKDAVTRNTNAEQSITLVLQGVVQQLKEAQASGDPNAIQDVITQIDANTKVLADAATANTPVAAPAAPAPAPPATP